VFSDIQLVGFNRRGKSSFLRITLLSLILLRERASPLTFVIAHVDKIFGALYDRPILVLIRITRCGWLISSHLLDSRLLDSGSDEPGYSLKGTNRSTPVWADEWSSGRQSTLLLPKATVRICECVGSYHRTV